MGQSYLVYVKADLNDRDGAIKALQNKIHNANKERTNYNLDKWKEQGFGIETFDDLMRIFLAGWKGQEITIEEDIYSNEFNATYGWEFVMIEMFQDIAPFLNDGSYIEISPEHGIVKYVVKNGVSIEKPVYVLDAEDSPICDYQIFEDEKECVNYLEHKTGLRKTIKEWLDFFEFEDLTQLGDEWEDAYVEFTC